MISCWLGKGGWRFILYMGKGLLNTCDSTWPCSSIPSNQKQIPAPIFQMKGLGEALTWNCAVFGRTEIKALHLIQGLSGEFVSSEQQGIIRGNYLMFPLR